MTTVQPVSFGYNHPLKTAFDKGLLPKGLKGLYGVTLTKKNRSIEHLKPHCKGGKLSLDNVALADKYMNFKQRGCLNETAPYRLSKIPVSKIETG